MRSLLFLIMLVAALKTEHISCVLVNETIFSTLNEYRVMVGNALALTRSYELSKSATAYAQHLATLNIKDQTLYEVAKNNIIDHMDYPPSDPGNKDYTENICEITRKRPDYPIQYWYAAGDHFYDRESKERSKVQQSLVDKYTAMFWKSSTKVGIGLASKDKNNKKGRWILVMRFTPPGNKAGEYDANISVMKIKLPTTTEKSSGGRQGPVLWIFIVLSIQYYLLVKWVTQISN